MIPNVAIVCRPAGPLPYAARRQAELAAEARRLGHRRAIADAVARRSLANPRRLDGEAPARIARKARRRATRLGVVFHRAIEALWAAGGFDEALAIFREHRRDQDRRSARLARLGL